MPASAPPRPAAFLDRDGVLNRDVGYIHRSADFDWVPGAREAVRRLNRLGYLTVVVTNQAGIAHGLHTGADVEALHAWVNRELVRAGAQIDAFYYSPYHPDIATETYSHLRHWRKPAPGMLLQAMRDFAIDRARSFLIGDKDTDLAAAAAAGVAGHLFGGPDLLAFLDTVVLAGAPAPGD